jgi:hypothetical protein
MGKRVRDISRSARWPPSICLDLRANDWVQRGRSWLACLTRQYRTNKLVCLSVCLFDISVNRTSLIQAVNLSFVFQMLFCHLVNQSVLSKLVKIAHPCLPLQSQQAIEQACHVTQMASLAWVASSLSGWPIGVEADLCTL